MRINLWLGILGIVCSTFLSATPAIEYTLLDPSKGPIGPAIAKIVEKEAATDAANLESAEPCSSWGYYLCPSSGETFDYDPPRCGGFTKPVAKGQCERACDTRCQD